MRDFIEDHPLLSGLLIALFGMFFAASLYALAVCPPELIGIVQDLAKDISPKFIEMYGIVFLGIIALALVAWFRNHD